MKQYLSRLFALVLTLAISLVSLAGCSLTPAGLTGDYRQDTLSLINSLKTAIELPEDSPDKAAAESDARGKINVFTSQYRRDDSVAGLRSFTTMKTALNSLASYYIAYPNRPLPEKLKSRLDHEFAQVETALERGS